MSVDWKNLWLKVKGYPWSKDKCSTHLKIFYNCLVQASCFNFDQDLTWFNRQATICCRSVLILLNSAEGCEISDQQQCCDVVGVFKQCLVAISTSDQKEAFQELNRCGLCLVVIWIMMRVPTSTIVEFVELLDEQMCRSINVEVFYIARKIRDIRFQTSSCFALTELALLEQCHPSLLYVFLTNLYENEQYHDLIKLTNNKDAPVAEQTVLTRMHNLTACCYFKLGKPLLAIMHWRKAVSSAQDEFCLMPLLYNLHQVYSSCNMIEPAIEMLKLVLNIATSKSADYGSESWCVFDAKKDHFLNLKVTKRHAISNAVNLAYYAGNYYAGIGRCSYAVEWYDYFLTHLRAEYDPALSTNASEYQLVNVVPPVMQITSEYALALYNSENLNRLLALDTKELSYCASAFKRTQGSTFLKLANKEPLTNAERVAFASTGDQLYNCISTSLFKLAAVMCSDFSASKCEIEHCLAAVDMVAPTIQPSTVQGDLSEETDEELVLNIGSRLCSLKAFLYFNLALVLSKLPHGDDKEILCALQQALRFDSRNIIMRWNVTLLLWDIGQPEESIKTWCKTRNINYKLSSNEINELKHAKLKELETCTSDTKKSYISKDVSILSELALLIS